MLSQKFAPALHGHTLALGDVLKTFGGKPEASYTVEAFATDHAVYLRNQANGRCDWYTAFCLPLWFYSALAGGGN